MDLVPIWYKDRYCTPPPTHTHPGYVKIKVTDLEISRNKMCNIRRAILSSDRSCLKNMFSPPKYTFITSDYHNYRCPLFRPSICLSTFMSKFDIYVKVSILINYKTKQPSDLAWNISLTSWLCDIGICFSVCLSVCPSVCQHLCQSSTFMSV